eukprot:5498513-Pyramimonas_sp.AAC.2
MFKSSVRFYKWRGQVHGVMRLRYAPKSRRITKVKRKRMRMRKALKQPVHQSAVHMTATVFISEMSEKSVSSPLKSSSSRHLASRASANCRSLRKAWTTQQP